jgi:hypothetical protein
MVAIPDVEVLRVASLAADAEVTNQSSLFPTSGGRGLRDASDDLLVPGGPA